MKVNIEKVNLWSIFSRISNHLDMLYLFLRKKEIGKIFPIFEPKNQLSEAYDFADSVFYFESKGESTVRQDLTL
jgi:hypothetical protein